MGDKEKDRLLENFSRARSRNALEDRLLKRNLNSIDTKLKSRLSNLNNEINQQRRLVVMLRNEAALMRKSVNSERELMSGMSTSHERNRFGSIESCNNMPAAEDGREIKVAGQSLSITSDIRPHMLFWSQDASTKLPTMTGFYGYRFSFQRSLTEVKLLGQNVYPERNGKRDIQSADPVIVREVTNHNIRRIQTTSAPKPHQREYYREDTRLTSHPPPPPTREGTHPLMVTQETTLPKLTRSDNVHAPPEEINLNLKSLPSDEELLHDTNRSSVRNRIKGTAPGDLRAPDITKRQKTCLAEGIFKTREEATKSNQLTLKKKAANKESDRRPVQTTITDLERSYTHVPAVMTEVNRLRSSTDREHAKSARQYTKTAFGIHMQSAISKKVLNKTGLPPAFRKNYSTYLKHYGTPIMEERLVPHYNTPVTVHN